MWVTVQSVPNLVPADHHQLDSSGLCTSPITVALLGSCRTLLWPWLPSLCHPCSLAGCCWMDFRRGEHSPADSWPSFAPGLLLWGSPPSQPLWHLYGTVKAKRVLFCSLLSYSNPCTLWVIQAPVISKIKVRGQNWEKNQKTATICAHAKMQAFHKNSTTEQKRKYFGHLPLEFIFSVERYRYQAMMLNSLAMASYQTEVERKSCKIQALL